LILPYSESHAKEMSLTSKAQTLYQQAQILLSQADPQSFTLKDKKEIDWEGRLLIEASRYPIYIKEKLNLYADCLKDIRDDQLYEWECEPDEYSSLADTLSGYMNSNSRIASHYVPYGSEPDDEESLVEPSFLKETPHGGEVGHVVAHGAE
jgi:hypothetical protein